MYVRVHGNLEIALIFPLGARMPPVILFVWVCVCVYECTCVRGSVVQSTRLRAGFQPPEALKQSVKSMCVRVCVCVFECVVCACVCA